MDAIKKERFLELLTYLNHGLVERDGTLKVALLTMLAGENLLLVGPPGTAKSLIARKLANCLIPSDNKGQPSSYFEYLLTKFSTPEEIFGPLSISALKMDQFKRNTEGYLPSVRLAFLDEIFKASSSILNALLTILNERRFHNGAVAIDIPLQSLIAASNELPTGQEELDALYDRFLVRSFVGYVSDDNLPRLLDKRSPEPTIRALSESELVAIRELAADVSVPENIISALKRIWSKHRQEFKEDRREHLSDRRLTKVVNLLRVAAACNERAVVDLSDLLLLKDCLWNHPDNAVKVRNLVLSVMEAFNVPITQSEEETQPLSSHQVVLHSPTAKLGIVIKGFRGSGTEQDPILIESVRDLAGLERSDVGLKNYWFRQTTDIDCCELTTWLNIDFQGTYDGGGYTIEYKRPDWISLFKKLQKGSFIRNVRLRGVGLAIEILESEVMNCASDVKLASYATESKIFACESGEALIGAATKSLISHCAAGAVLFQLDVSECEISNCRSQNVLISGSAKDCDISNCEVLTNCAWSFPVRNQAVGGIARSLTSSNVQGCIVSGQATSQDAVYFSAITSHCEDSIIRRCAMGAFSFDTFVKRSDARLVGEVSRGSQLENNVVLDSDDGISQSAKVGSIGFPGGFYSQMANGVFLGAAESDPNGPDGKTISRILFTQHYFENVLDWDFKDVWQWRDLELQPRLREVGIGAARICAPSRQASNTVGDLLGQQLSANLWL